MGSGHDGLQEIGPEIPTLVKDYTLKGDAHGRPAGCEVALYERGPIEHYISNRVQQNHLLPFGTCGYKIYGYSWKLQQQ